MNGGNGEEGFSSGTRGGLAVGRAGAGPGPIEADRHRAAGGREREPRIPAGGAGMGVPVTFPAQSGAPAAMYHGSCRDSGVKTSLNVAPMRMLLLLVNAGPA